MYVQNFATGYNPVIKKKNNKMKCCSLFVLLLYMCHLLSAQAFTAELMPGNQYLFYQHSSSQKFKPNGKAGIVHIANILNWYEKNPTKGGMNDELMNQVYISMQAGRYITVMGGLFYTNVTGIRPALALQFMHVFKQGVLVLAPRADLISKGSAEVMGMIEYHPQVSKQIKLYSRFQFMSNIGPYHHNRSYQRARLGVHIKSFQAGIGINLDEYGYAGKLKVNAGLFLRKAF